MRLAKSIFPILQWLPDYRKEHLGGDLFAGLTVGVMLIPQGMAYALIAGLPPVYGLYASIVPQIIYAIFGTSRQLSVAPVAMDSLLVASGVSVLATEGSDAYIGFAILLAFFMGAFQLLFGIFRMGFITNLLSKPVISGFTSAAAIIIGLNQLKYLLGTDIAKSNRVYEVLWNGIQKLNETHLITFITGVAGIVIITSLKKLNPKLPGALFAVALGIGAVYFLSLHEQGVWIVREIPEGLPAFSIPSFELGMFGKVIPLALTISVVAFMEAYSVSKAIEAKKKDHHVRPNQELVALGLSNMAGSFFQTFPVTGGFSRSAVNYQSGANTPLSSVISALLITITLLFLTPLFYYLPTAILASVIMVAVSGLIDVKYIKKLWGESRIEFGILVVTFMVTLNFSMVPGIVSGVAASILYLLYKSANPHIAVLGRLKGQTEFRNIKRFKDLEVWEEKLIMRIDASLTFINIQYIKDFITKELDKNDSIREVLIDASSVSHVDATAMLAMQDLIASLHAKGIKLILCDVIGPVRDVLFETGLLKAIGVENVYLTLHDAIENALGSEAYENKEKAIQHGMIE